MGKYSMSSVEIITRLAPNQDADRRILLRVTALFVYFWKTGHILEFFFSLKLKLMDMYMCKRRRKYR